ncbi:hypothetical protein [Desulfonatronum thioautotrophicum]|nr:hypothetical protein [Desulfonatronum thioautotrophicum]
MSQLVHTVNHPGGGSVTEMRGPPASGMSIPVADHCYACCIAGTGFT